MTCEEKGDGIASKLVLDLDIGQISRWEDSPPGNFRYPRDDKGGGESV